MGAQASEGYKVMAVDIIYKTIGMNKLEASQFMVGLKFNVIVIDGKLEFGIYNSDFNCKVLLNIEDGKVIGAIRV